jgi:hypothetical protein
MRARMSAVGSFRCRSPRSGSRREARRTRRVRPRGRQACHGGRRAVARAEPGDERGDDVDLPASARTADRTAQSCVACTNRRADSGEQREPGADRSTGCPHPPSRSRLHLRAARLRAGRPEGTQLLRAALRGGHFGPAATSLVPDWSFQVLPPKEQGETKRTQKDTKAQLRDTTAESP